MADAGIIVRNSSGVSVINNNFKGICLSRKIPASSLAVRDGYRGYTDPWTGFNKAAMLARNIDLLDGEMAAVAIGPISLLYNNKVQAAYDYTTNKNMVVYNNASDINGLYVFTFKYNNPGGINYGFEVYDENGSCVFDSNKNQMLIYGELDDFGINIGSKSPASLAVMISPFSMRLKNGNNYNYVVAQQYISSLSGHVQKRICFESAVLAWRAVYAETTVIDISYY